MIFIIALLAIGGFYIYKMIDGNKIVSTDTLYQQRGITINYAAGTIQIKKSTYPVNQITSVTKITNFNGRRKDHYIKIDVDDMAKPVHKIPVLGSEHNADEFQQRICVALGKAGARGFI